MQFEILSNVVQSDGRLAIQARFTTERNSSKVKHFLLPEGTYALAYIEGKEAEVVEQFKNDELNSISKSIELNRSTVSELLSNLEYANLRDVLIYFIGRAIYTSDVFELIRIKKVAVYTSAKYTNNQIVGNSAFTLEQVELYYSRVAAAVDIEPNLNAIKESASNE